MFPPLMGGGTCPPVPHTCLSHFPLQIDAHAPSHFGAAVRIQMREYFISPCLIYHRDLHQQTKAAESVTLLLCNLQYISRLKKHQRKMKMQSLIGQGIE